MRNESKLVLIAFLSLICILSISSVSAADFNGGSLTALNESIQNNDDGIININGDIYADMSDSIRFNNSAICIDKDLTVEGNNHVIDMSQSDIQLFDINNEHRNNKVTIRNLVLEGFQIYSDRPAISVGANSQLILENVTFRDSVAYYIIYSQGDVLITNSSFISCISVLGIYSTNIHSKLTIENSSFENSQNSLIYIAQGKFKMTDTEFRDNTNLRLSFISSEESVISNCLFQSNIFDYDIENAMSYLYVNNSIFANNTVGNYGIFSTAMETYLNHNIFIGNRFSSYIINEYSKNTLFLNGNYFGTNTPKEDGVIITSQVIDSSNTVFVEIGCGDDVDLSNLKIGEPVDLTIRYVGSGCENLEAISANIIFDPNYAVSNQTSIILSSNPAYFTLTPTKSGNYNLLLDSGYLNPIAKINLNNEFIVLKNYTLALNSPASIGHGEVLGISLNLSDDSGNPITGTVNIKIGENNYPAEVIDGKGYVEIIGLDAGQYLINATYFTSDYFYNDANNLTSLEITKSTPAIEVVMDDTVAGENKVITVKLPSDATGRVQMVITSLSGQGGFFQLENGQASYTFTGLTTGTKSLFIYYEGDGNYYSSEKSVNFYVAPYIPDTPDVPTDPDVPDTPDVPIDPDVPDVPDYPDTPDVPDYPAVPDVPDLPGIPDIPDVPDLPGVPDEPSVPDVPDTPAVPDVPTGPVNPDTPATPQNPENTGNNQTDSSNEGNLDMESSTSSDDINSNEASENQNVQVGSTANNAVSRAGSQSNSPGEDSSTAHEISRKSVNRDIGSDNYFVLGIVLAAIAILLLILGYKSRKDDDDS